MREIRIKILLHEGIGITQLQEEIGHVIALVIPLGVTSKSEGTGERKYRKRETIINSSKNDNINRVREVTHASDRIIEENIIIMHILIRMTMITNNKQEETIIKVVIAITPEGIGITPAREVATIIITVASRNSKREETMAIIAEGIEDRVKNDVVMILVIGRILIIIMRNEAAAANRGISRKGDIKIIITEDRRGTSRKAETHTNSHSNSKLISRYILIIRRILRM